MHPDTFLWRWRIDSSQFNPIFMQLTGSNTVRVINIWCNSGNILPVIHQMLINICPVEQIIIDVLHFIISYIMCILTAFMILFL